MSLRIVVLMGWIAGVAGNVDAVTCYEIVDASDATLYRATVPPFPLEGSAWSAAQTRLRAQGRHLMWFDELPGKSWAGLWSGYVVCGGDCPGIRKIVDAALAVEPPVPTTTASNRRRHSASACSISSTGSMEASARVVASASTCFCGMRKP